MKPICISGGTFIGNHGAEAMLTTCIGRIRERYPDVPIAVLSPYYAEDKAVLKRDDIILLNSSPLYLSLVLFPLSLLAAFLKLIKLSKLICCFPKAVRVISEASAQIDVAGVSFMDSRQMFLVFNVLSLMPALILNVPVIKFAQALGPFNRRLNRSLANFILKKCEAIFARGPDTLKNLQELNLPSEKVFLAPDVAFCHKLGDSITVENPEYCEKLIEKIRKRSEEKIIGICPSSLLASKSSPPSAYIEFVEEMITSLINSNYKIVLFPNATREKKMNTFRNNDLRIILDVKKKLNTEEKIIYVEKNITADTIKRIVMLCDVTVVSRFHTMITSLSTETPVFVLGWSHKYLEVMKFFDMSEYVVDYKKSNVNEVVEKVIKLMEHHNELSEKIKERFPKVYKNAFFQFEYLFKLLENK